MELEERFYTSTEVAEILGVSLRSIYRYLDEEKLKAEVKTATGRHRFTKQNILDFLYPEGKTEKEPKKEDVDKPVEEKVKKEPVVEVAVKEPEKEKLEKEEPKKAEPSEEPVDWLAKFRAAAEKHKQEVAKVGEAKEESAKAEETVSGLTVEVEEPAKKEEPKEVSVVNYYRSGVGGLKEIAQNLDKSAKKASIEYVFTMSAGLSLHKPIKPFSLLHVYVRSKDKEFFEKMLQLTTSSEGSAQLCLMVSDEPTIYSSKKEMHGLSVVSDVQLRKDLMDASLEDLAKELDTVVSGS